MTADGITPGKRYYVVNNHQDRGLHVRVHGSWDWVISAASAGDHGEPVIFHAYDDGGYVIESTYRNWGDHKYWTLDDKGVYLAKYDDAPVWVTVPTDNGFGLYKFGTADFVYSPGSGEYIKAGRWDDVRFSLKAGKGQEFIPSVTTKSAARESKDRDRFEFKAIPA